MPVLCRDVKRGNFRNFYGSFLLWSMYISTNMDINIKYEDPF